jgi:copper chaperone
MSCQGCVKSVTAVLAALPGVEQVEVSLATATAEISHDPARSSVADFRQAIEDAGFDAN